MMNLRRRLFFLLDRNHSVADQLMEIKRANADDAFAEKLRDCCISDLLRHVREHVPFYREVKADRLAEFPVVNKVMMKEDITAFRSTTDYVLGKKRHTSGSTGIPFEIWQDERKAHRIQAELIYYRELTGDRLGTRFINPLSPSRMQKRSRLSEKKQNVIDFDVTKMDAGNLERLHRLLCRDRHIHYMMGYASALKQVADYFEASDYKAEYSLKAIVSSSEIMTDATIRKLSLLFGCPVYDRYSNEDNGFISQTLAMGGGRKSHS